LKKAETLLEVLVKTQDNQTHKYLPEVGDHPMNALTGMEKFSHLEDKIYLTVEFTKKMRDDNEKLAREADGLKRQAASAVAERNAIEEKLTVLLSERDIMQQKVEAMLEAIMSIDADMAGAAAK